MDNNNQSAKENLIEALVSLVKAKGLRSDEGERALVALGKLADSPAACGFLASQYSEIESGLLQELVEAMAPAAVTSAGVRTLLLEWIKAEACKLMKHGKTKVHRAAMWALGKAAEQPQVQQLLLDLLMSPWLAGLASTTDKHDKEVHPKKLAEFAEEVAQIAGDALASQLESDLVLNGFAGLVANAGTPEFIRRGALDVLSGRKW